MKNSHSFPLTSDECELLLLFEFHHHLQDVAQAMGRDHSVVARALKKIAERFPVVEKKAGKWVLTETGKAFNHGTRSAIQLQKAALNTRRSLRIGTNREFGSRVLAADFLKFQKLFPEVELSIHCYQGGVEAALLSSQIDVGIDCERPQDPDVVFKLAADEYIVAVASPVLTKIYKKRGTVDLHEWPHLFCERLNPDKILARAETRTRVVARFNDIATTRAACALGVGWAFLPYYAVKQELFEGRLVQVSPDIYGKSKYGVWWLRARPYMREPCEKISGWLSQQELSPH